MSNPCNIDLTDEQAECYLDRYVDLKDALLKTDKKRLIEYSPRDSYWGTFWNKKGQNRLGCILEIVREELNL